MKSVLLMIIFTSFVCIYGVETQSVELPAADTLMLESYSSFDFSEIDESSAMVKSRQWDDLWWTLNDSGGENKLYPVNRNGELYRAEWYKADQGGVVVGNAVNIDWESMAADNDGNLYIAGCGNNMNVRRDLCIYVLKDPHPLATGTTRSFMQINFYYPEQGDFPPSREDYNYDCEALFWAEGRLFLLTKHRSDTHTRLYTFNSLYPERENEVTLLSEFDIQGMVTAADCSIDGTKLAVLTYNAVWVFEGKAGAWFDGKISWLPVSLKQCEGIGFDNDDVLIISNEQTELFELKVSDMIEVR